MVYKMNYKLQMHFLNDVTTWRAYVSALINMDIIKSPFLHQCRFHSNGNGFKIGQKSFIQSSSNLQEVNHIGFSCQQSCHFLFQPLGWPWPPIKLSPIFVAHLSGGFFKAPDPKAPQALGWDKPGSGSPLITTLRSENNVHASSSLNNYSSS